MRLSNLLRILVVAFTACISVSETQAFSLSLDSIAEWGRFPKFVIDTYRWGDGFFNGYDTLYVKSTGYKFNTKFKCQSWIDTYSFFLPEAVKMRMSSEPSTSMGLWLTYLAVSGGYDKNVSSYFGSNNSSKREQFSFGFNCSLFAFNMSFINNAVGVRVTHFGPVGESIKPDIDFNGLKSNFFNCDLYYFFNHKRYSQAAAFGFSRIQTRSQGSWFAGMLYSNQEFHFDFNGLPSYIIEKLPESWTDHKYEAVTKNLAVKFGYGYNWVFKPKWVLGVSESPAIGLKRGKINNPDEMHTTFTFTNQFMLSLVWNHKRWFAGAIGVLDTALVYQKDSSFQNSVFTGSVMVGYRFNLW